MEKMIEVEIDIFDEEEWMEYMKSKQDGHDDEMSEVDRLVHQVNHGPAKSMPKPVVGKFRFLPSAVISIYETYSLDMKESGKKKINRLGLVFNTGMEQIVRLTLKEYDALVEKYEAENEPQLIIELDEGAEDIQGE